MMYKEAGLFDPISSSVEVTEFTIKDAYTPNFFRTTPPTSGVVQQG
ncbi:hypothetical protein BDA96_03G347600 [Sorghum bicolor]|nr:hypothetical protein BDA96_03G347600 [Sorghum bicolor]